MASERKEKEILPVAYPICRINSTEIQEMKSLSIQILCRVARTSSLRCDTEPSAEFELDSLNVLKYRADFLICTYYANVKHNLEYNLHRTCTV